MAPRDSWARPVVVSNADIKRTFLELLAPEVVPEALRRKVRGFEMSLPIGVVYAVLDRDLAAEGVPVTNFRWPATTSRPPSERLRPAGSLLGRACGWHRQA